MDAHRICGNPATPDGSAARLGNGIRSGLISLSYYFS